LGKGLGEKRSQEQGPRNQQSVLDTKNRSLQDRFLGLLFDISVDGV